MLIRSEFGQCASFIIGALPQTPVTFLSPINRDVPLDTKKSPKKVKTSPISLKKLTLDD